MRGMTLIVKTTAGVLLGFIAMFGLHVVVTGHMEPGGGFAGGVILAAGLLLMVLAFGADEMRERLGERLAVIWESVGAIGFLVVALLGFVAGAFFSNFLPRATGFELFSGGSIPFADIAIALNVGAGLFGAFLMLAAYRTARGKDQREGRGE